MSEPVISSAPALVADAAMLIRRPVHEVFEAIVDPAVTTRFWFTHGSGRLERGERVRWDWEMYDLSVDVEVVSVEPDRRVVVRWSAYGAPTDIEWTLEPQPDGTTFVRVENRGFAGDEDEIVRHALDSKGGFAFVLAGMKAWLEHGIELNLVADHMPHGVAT